MKLEITTHSSNEVDIVEVESYDSEKVADQLNDNDIHAIAIGNNVYSRIDIKNIKPYTEDEG